MGGKWVTKKQVRITIPARPFLGLSEDDTLELWEYIPQTITAKSGSSSGSSSSSGKSGGGAASNLKADYKSYLSNERGKSPARDDADATAAMNKVTAMPY